MEDAAEHVKRDKGQIDANIQSQVFKHLGVGHTVDEQAAGGIGKEIDGNEEHRKEDISL